MLFTITCVPQRGYSASCVAEIGASLAERTHSPYRLPRFGFSGLALGFVRNMAENVAIYFLEQVRLRRKVFARMELM